jgi:O-antigen/teichoic acid export membrane protein
MLLVFTTVGALLTDAGFSAALIQRPSISADDEKTMFCVTVLAGLVTAGGLWAGAQLIADFYHQPTLVALTRAMALVLPLGALGAVPNALLTKRLDFKARARAQVIASSVSGLLAIILAWRGFGVWCLALQGLSSTGLRSLLLWAFSGWKPHGQFRETSLRALFGFGGYMLLATLFNTVAGRTQSLLLGRLFDANSLGFYSLAENAQQVPTSFIGALLSRVGLPAFSAMASKPDRLREALRISLQVSLFIFVPCMAGLALLAKPLIIMIYGERWNSAAPILSLLALAGALWPMQVLNLSVLSAQGRADRILWLEIYKDGLGVTLLLIVARYGVIAIAAATLVASLVSTVINAWYSRSMLNYGLVRQLLDQRKTFMLSLAAAVPAWSVLHWTRQGILPTVFAIVTAGCVYILGAVIMRHEALIELLKLTPNFARAPSSLTSTKE